MRLKDFSDSFKEILREDYPNLTGDQPVVRKKMIVVESCWSCQVWQKCKLWQDTAEEGIRDDCPLPDLKENINL